MFEEIKQYFFQKKITEDFSQNISKRNLIEFSKSKKIGLAYDASDYDTITQVRDLEVKLKQEGKNVQIFAFINSDDKKFEPFLFTKKDLNWYGYPTKKQLVEFANQDFDFLLGIFNNINSPLNAIFALSKSKMRVGMNYGQSPDLFDIILGSSKVQKTRDILPILINFVTSIKTQ